jgi:hypothetical protein
MYNHYIPQSDGSYRRSAQQRPSPPPKPRPDPKPEPPRDCPPEPPKPVPVPPPKPCPPPPNPGNLLDFFRIKKAHRKADLLTSEQAVYLHCGIHA